MLASGTFLQSLKVLLHTYLVEHLRTLGTFYALKSKTTPSFKYSTQSANPAPYIEQNLLAQPTVLHLIREVVRQVSIELDHRPRSESDFVLLQCQVAGQLPLLNQSFRPAFAQIPARFELRGQIQTVDLPHSMAIRARQLVKNRPEEA